MTRAADARPGKMLQGSDVGNPRNGLLKRWPSPDHSNSCKPWLPVMAPKIVMMLKLNKNQCSPWISRKVASGAI